MERPCIKRPLRGLSRSLLEAFWRPVEKLFAGLSGSFLGWPVKRFPWGLSGNFWGWPVKRLSGGLSGGLLEAS